MTPRIEAHDPPQTAYDKAAAQLDWELSYRVALDVRQVDETGLAINRINFADSEGDTFLITRQRLRELICSGVCAAYEVAPAHCAEALRDAAEVEAVGSRDFGRGYMHAAKVLSSNG